MTKSMAESSPLVVHIPSNSRASIRTPLSLARVAGSSTGVMFLSWDRAQLCDRLSSPNGESLVDCSSLHTMPNVEITIEGKTCELTPDQCQCCDKREACAAIHI